MSFGLVKSIFDCEKRKKNVCDDQSQKKLLSLGMQYRSSEDVLLVRVSAREKNLIKLPMLFLCNIFEIIPNEMNVNCYDVSTVYVNRNE